MGQDPDAIRQEIERTRDEMSETIDAIGYKADVPARSKEAVSDKVDAVKDKVSSATDTVKEKAGMATGTVKDKAGTVSDRTPSKGQVKGKAKQGVSVAKSNPLGLGVGALAVGFLAGMLIPETQKEHETLGPLSDKVKENVQDTAQEALEHGKQVAQETAGAAKEAAQSAAQEVKGTAQSAAQEHGQQVKETAQENAQTTAQQARQAAPTPGT